MTLQEAIERLQQWLDTPYRETPVDFRDALRLGIEAMKRVQAHRASSLQNAHILLPGETEE